MSEKRCETCAHWRRNNGERTWGECHAGTPQPVVNTTGTGNLYAHWPQTWEGNDCRGWTPQPQQQKREPMVPLEQYQVVQDECDRLHGLLDQACAVNEGLCGELRTLRAAVEAEAREWDEQAVIDREHGDLSDARFDEEQAAALRKLLEVQP